MQLDQLQADLRTVIDVLPYTRALDFFIQQNHKHNFYN